MKRGLFVALSFILISSMFFVSAAVGDDNILTISSNTNAHGGLWNVFAYDPIFYSTTYGWDYITANPHTGGTIIRLSSNTNAHAQIPEDVCSGIVKECNEYGHSDETECNSQLGCNFNTDWWDECEGTAVRCEDFNDSASCNAQVGCSFTNRGAPYSTSVQYGDLVCRAKKDNEGPCNRPNEQCIVRLSDWTNAHLADCSDTSYPIQICCESELDCSQFTTKTQCDGYDTCGWSPTVNNITGIKTTSNSDGGGCCSFGKRWNAEQGSCGSTINLICNNAWTASNVGDVKQEEGRWYYCAQATPGISTGYWELVVAY